MKFLRFLARPSSLDILDDPEFQDTQVLAISKEFQPRPMDNGFLSIWNSSGTNRDFVISGFCSRRSSLQVASFLEFSKIIADDCSLSIACEPDLETFPCLKSLHFSCSVIDEKKVEAFAKILFCKLREGSLEVAKERLSKSEVILKMRAALDNCMDKEKEFSLSPAQNWAKAFVKTT